MTEDRKGRDAPDEKSLGRSPDDKSLGRSPGDKAAETTAARVNRENRERAEGRELEEGEEPTEFGPDGCYHVMQEEMLANAEAGNEPFTVDEVQKPSVVHAEELRVKAQYGDGVAPIDPTPPDPEAPIDARSLGEPDRNPKPTQLPADKRGRR